MEKWGVALAMMVMVLSSCTEKVSKPKGYQTYIIKEGQHESNHDFEDVINDSVLEFKVIFDSTAIYNINNSNDADINKLFGMSDCGLLHHINSARIGWRWFNNKLELFAYSYNNGERTTEFIGAFHIGMELNCKIYFVRDQYIFEVNGKKVTSKRSCKTNEHFLLYPYFGGNENAPHAIKIKIHHISNKE